MDDKTLADAVVALGVGYFAPKDVYGIPPDGSGERKTAHDFVRDWRVAGALMEKMAGSAMSPCEWYFMSPLWKVYTNGGGVRNESLPRAIIEACVEALNG